MSSAKPWLTAALATACLATAASPQLCLALEYGRGRVADGEYWRMYTSSFTHFGASHTGWNLVLLCVVGGALERVAPWTVRLHYLIAPAGVGLALWFSPTSPFVYRGFSGVAAGLVTLLAFHLWQSGNRGVSITVAALLGAKLLVESLSPGSAQLTSYEGTGIETWAVAHLVGVATALAVSYASSIPRLDLEQSCRSHRCL